MPELPEVESIARSLRRKVVGLRIAGIDCLWPKLLRGDPEELTALTGQTVVSVGRRGKHLLLACGDRVLVFHLKMTGRFLWSCPGKLRGRHVRLVMRFDGSSRELHFEDVRKFGFVRPVGAAELAACPEIRRLGPEPLRIQADAFAARLRARRGRIKSVLLDQTFVAGIGNIYADEMLFEAGIHPLTTASRLSRARADRLWTAMRDVLGRAVAAGGSSIRNYRDADGVVGSFQDDHRVYGRGGEACRRCGSSVRRAVIGGRSSHYCARCQRR